jgi:hypothetical protein
MRCVVSRKNSFEIVEIIDFNEIIDDADNLDKLEKDLTCHRITAVSRDALCIAWASSRAVA